tara:strand:- start:37 stop:213 length:177 start_codon:yes stop_codon:yes gene_type:complete
MTKYQKLKALAKSKGIDARKDQYASGGYWLYNSNGLPLYPDDNFCANLQELERELRAI